MSSRRRRFPGKTVVRNVGIVEDRAKDRPSGNNRRRDSLLDPLDKIYRESGLTRPSIEPVEGKQVPEPYRSLLVHPRDLTPTLEKAFDDRIHLRVIRRRNAGLVELREVVLVLDRDETPVAFGAIRMHLNHLPADVRTLIREGRLPFGRVLQDSGVEHSSRPVGYFQVLSDMEIGEAFGLGRPRYLYGRRNRLLDASDRPLAEVVEVLPPADIPLPGEAGE